MSQTDERIFFRIFAPEDGAAAGSLPGELNREAGGNPELCPQLCRPERLRIDAIEEIAGHAGHDRFFEKAGAGTSQKTCHRPVAQSGSGTSPCGNVNFVFQ